MHVVPAHFQAGCTRGERSRNCIDCTEQSIIFLSIGRLCLDAPGDALLLERMNPWSHPRETPAGAHGKGPSSKYHQCDQMAALLI